MKNVYKNRLFVFFCLLVFGMGANSLYAKAPVIESFSVDAVDQLSPGTELLFTLEGSPKGKATVKINGLKKSVPLKETSAGIYEGGYTLKTNDRIKATGPVTATLTVGKQASTAKLKEPLVTSPIQTNVGSAAKAPYIERFTADQTDRVDPGTELKFSLKGTPGAQASFTIDGVVDRVVMQEVKSGLYEGSYTVRRNDRFPARAVATLESGGKVVHADLNQSQSVTTSPKVSAQKSKCETCGIVEAINVQEVTGEGSPLGTIAGGVVGGLLGHQVGQGSGKTVATIAGAAGGAYAGNQIERHVKKTKRFDVTVRMSDGTTQIVPFQTQPQFRVGDKVRFVNGNLTLDQ